MFKLYDQKQPNSGSQQNERIHRLEKELKIARRQEAYQAVINQMVNLSSPLSISVANVSFLNNSVSKKIDSLERELIKERTSNGCTSKDITTKSMPVNYLS